MEQGRNRVFVNPNFNKKNISNAPLRHTSIMHVNPNFCQHAQGGQPVPKAKIYINPNFVRPNSINNQNPYVNNFTTTQSYAKPSPLVDNSNTLTVPAAPTKHRTQSAHHASTVPMQAFHSNSRYSLVRQKKSEEPIPNIIKPQTNTVKINKYKSIKITDIKKKLESVAPAEKVTHFKVSSNHKSLIRDNSHQKASPKTNINDANRYRLVRPAVGKPPFKRQTSVTPKKVVYNRAKIKLGVYKKNNIPCPQYRKYGKCLRKLYRKCEFLHDKKHVSICRKFLNGVCHNDKCLLSHELSDKNMPTCYFYLKGMCTKDECPYLHVKLNEKAKICSDFMRGYCEKGDKCLNRHVAKSLNADQKRQSLKKLSQQKLMKYKLERNKVKSSINSTLKKKNKIQSDKPTVHENDSSASRYYKESVEESNTIENLEIKPSRCKLGTLPSFIQL